MYSSVMYIDQYMHVWTAVMSQEIRNVDLYQIYFSWISQSSFIKFQDEVNGFLI